MTEFMLGRAKDSIGPKFNEAVAILKEYKDLKIMASNEFSSGGAAFAVKTTLVIADELKKRLPGWKIDRT